MTLQPIRRYGFDAAILFSDILMVPWALGQALRFAEGEGPVLEPLRDAAAIAALRPASAWPNGVAPILRDGAPRPRRAGRRCPELALIGFAGSPFTVACYMVEGHGSPRLRRHPQHGLCRARRCSAG